ncbi:uncharacterized protein RCC_03529 [Ramularia collo-cygni]|uniref:Apple domain-containing protein n=1 Tax=Ramularia collo-cygni TaxID=112498 RepID=A0A2D3UNL1_9PEZI|nr:uncharacterized protein RCC_03529 [Ramularia collo-cygni]CZT17692.1 uncharacterized protein RCC_03529 [Ramularia collo-cygni]
MHMLALITALAGLASALPQKVCSTVTTWAIVPTTTATYSTTDVVTVSATTPMDLGTFTQVETISETNTLLTFTTTTTVCGATGIVSVPTATVTVYSGTDGYRKRAEGPRRRSEPCTVTSTATTTYGQTQVYAKNGKTSTYTAHTAFTQATITTTTYRGTEHVIATETATAEAVCGDVTETVPAWTSTVSMDSRCSPAAMIVEGRGFGIDYVTDVPNTGATYETTTDNASICCQLCAETDKCASSGWDIRSGNCKLEFPTKWDTGELSCGLGMMGMYAAGPNHPMSPGAGWYLAELCGRVDLFNAKPDDGT